jgi:hypothetical protein
MVDEPFSHKVRGEFPSPFRMSMPMYFIKYLCRGILDFLD